MQNLVDQRCFNHHLREAVARCPECTHFFCRECITEHDDRIICAACLRKLARKPSSDRRGFAGLLRFTQFVLGLAAAWFFFYLIGEALLALPDSFHEGEFWQKSWLDKE